MTDIKTLLVDDSKIFLESVEYYLSTFPHMNIVGKATSGAEALEKIAQHRPDLVLMDLEMPDMNGLEATRKVKLNSSAPFVIIVSYHNGDEYQSMAKEAGADGFISKDSFAMSVLPLIESIFSSKEVQEQNL